MYVDTAHYCTHNIRSADCEIHVTAEAGEDLFPYCDEDRDAAHAVGVAYDFVNSADEIETIPVPAAA